MSAQDRRWEQTHDAYFFDLDGTLVDTAPDLHAALNASLNAFDYAPVTLAETRDWVGQGARKLLHRAVSAHHHEHPPTFGEEPLLPVKELPLDAMHQHFLAHYGQAIATFSEPFPGVVEGLQALAARPARLAVVTNKPEGLARQLLEALNLTPLFGAIVGSDTTAASKPSPLPAQHAGTALGVAPAQVLFVGDSATDVATARAYGCPVVVMRYGYSQGLAPEALGADAVIDSFLALL